MMTHQIVVCDDEPHIVRAISLKFTRAGFDVKSAFDVESCWNLLRRDERPALLIVDTSMPPGPNGSELVRRIRGDVRLADLPVIMLTANCLDLIGQLDEFAELHLEQVVTKPFSPRELLALVRRILDSEPSEVLAATNYLASDCRL